jgi:hypothetical protein
VGPEKPVQLPIFPSGKKGVAPVFPWGGAIVWLSLTPAPPVIKTALLGWDKFQHFAAYGMLTLLGGRAFGGVLIRDRAPINWEQSPFIQKPIYFQRDSAPNYLR